MISLFVKEGRFGQNKFRKGVYSMADWYGFNMNAVVDDDVYRIYHILLLACKIEVCVVSKKIGVFGFFMGLPFRSSKIWCAR